MDDLRFYVLFNTISVKLGRGEVDNERLCGMIPLLLDNEQQITGSLRSDMFTTQSPS